LAASQILNFKFDELTFVKVLLLLFFQEKKRSLRRSLKVLILAFNDFSFQQVLALVFNKYGTRPSLCMEELFNDEDVEAIRRRFDGGAPDVSNNRAGGC
jgi:hypothetical protein